MKNLNLPNTKFLDLLGIIPLNISNFLTEVDHRYDPPSDYVVAAAQRATQTSLTGSDVPNLLTQARAIMRRVSIPTIVCDEPKNPLDIASIVTRWYPEGVMLDTKFKIDTLRRDDIVRKRASFASAFAHLDSFTDDEFVYMVKEFAFWVDKLQIAELMLHAGEFKIDLILEGLEKMPMKERFLRGRINAWMEVFLFSLVSQGDKDEGVTVCHVETQSLTLECIHTRMQEVVRLYSRYGEGAYLNTGMLFVGSGSSGITVYDVQKDTFPSYIQAFYDKHVKGIS